MTREEIERICLLFMIEFNKLEIKENKDGKIRRRSNRIKLAIETLISKLGK